MTRYPRFDRSRIKLDSLAARGDDLAITDCLQLAPPARPYEHAEYPELVARIVAARHADRPVILMMGGHPIKLGLSRFLVDLIQRKWISHLATNGSGIIHDFELATWGGTSEDVPKWIQRGQFGLWQQTSELNEVIRRAAQGGLGLGEAVGQYLEESAAAHRGLSVAAAGWRCGVPVTCHVGIGSDIIHAHPNCDGGALGATSYQDFLIFTQAVADLEGGVFLNVGTSVAGPEVYLKALSMARNVAHQDGQHVRHFTTAVFDLVELPSDYRRGPPGKDHPQYYYRPWKTILVRTVADGGQSYHFQGDHRQTIPTLWQRLTAGTAQESRAA